MRPKNFTCIFPNAGNVHLIKDIGMVANVLARTHGWDSHLVCLDRGQEFAYLRDEARWLKVDRIPDDPAYHQFRRPPRTALRYLRENARRIDVLQLYNHTRETMLLALAYKLFNPRGFLYLKLDANEPWLEGEVARKRSSRWIAASEYLLHDLWVAGIPDLVTAETLRSLELFRRLHPGCAGRIELLPNGFDDAWLQREGFGEPKPEDKQDLLITVGRIGTEQKNNEMLLDALETLDLGRWTVALVGPIEDGFRPRLQAFRERRPDLAERVLVPGAFDDRRALYDWYRRAKVFCLTSTFEGFSLALVDALHFGCHVVSTPVSSLGDILDQGRLGAVVDSPSALREELSAIFSGRRDPLATFAAVRRHSEAFRWSDIGSRLAGFLERARSKRSRVETAQ